MTVSTLSLRYSLDSFCYLLKITQTKKLQLGKITNKRMRGKKIGYIRVSSVDQKIDRQLEGLKLDKCFIDKASGKDVNRPQLEAMLDYVRDGDHIIIHSMDRLARNLNDLRQLVEKLTSQKIKIEFIKESLVFTGDDKPMSKLLLSIMGAVAEFERALIKERQREGIEIAKKKGKYKGRPPSLSQEQIESIRIKSKAGEKISIIAKEFNICRQSVYKYIK